MGKLLSLLIGVVILVTGILLFKGQGDSGQPVVEDITEKVSKDINGEEFSTDFYSFVLPTNWISIDQTGAEFLGDRGMVQSQVALRNNDGKNSTELAGITVYTPEEYVRIQKTLLDRGDNNIESLQNAIAGEDLDGFVSNSILNCDNNADLSLCNLATYSGFVELNGHSSYMILINSPEGISIVKAFFVSKGYLLEVSLNAARDPNPSIAVKDANDPVRSLSVLEFYQILSTLNIK